MLPVLSPPLPRPLTSTGTELFVLVSSPSCPEELLPQHLTAPDSVRAQVWSVPALIAFTPLPRPLTSTGTELFVLVSSPSCPEELAPQHLTAPGSVRAQV